MSVEEAALVRPARVIVVANEKGGSGKSTVAMHVAVALIKRGQRVATIDLDARQRSFTHYVENRRDWGKRVGRDLGCPEHSCIDASDAPAGADAARVLTDAVGTLAQSHDFVVIDTPGHDGPLMRQAHAIADMLITPLNDSFIDLDVLGSFDPDSFNLVDTSHYARTVEEARLQRQMSGQDPLDWIVLRNRLSMTPTRNKRHVGAGLQELAQRLGFRSVEGLAERVIFREFYLRGLTALDDLDETTLGTRPTMSHVSARQEVEQLLNAMNLAMNLDRAAPTAPLAEPNRDAA